MKIQVYLCSENKELDAIPTGKRITIETANIESLNSRPNAPQVVEIAFHKKHLWSTRYLEILAAAPPERIVSAVEQGGIELAPIIADKQHPESPLYLNPFWVNEVIPLHGALDGKSRVRLSGEHKFVVDEFFPQVREDLALAISHSTKPPRPSFLGMAVRFTLKAAHLKK